LPADISSATAVLGRRRRLVWVRFLRRTLPMVATVVLVAVVGQVVWRAVRMVMIPQAAAPAAAVRMINPSFTGESRDGSRYQVTARSGVRDGADDSRIVLEAPTVSVTHGDNTGTRTTAQRGVFRQDAMTLALEGDVKVAENSGYNFTFKNAVFDTRTGQVTGKGVGATGPDAQISSDQYTVYDKGERMVFKGRVRGRLNDR